MQAMTGGAVRWLLCGVLALGLLSSTPARAEQVRFRYAPAGPDGALTQVAAGPGGAAGERRRGFAGEPEPYPFAVRPNQMMTFRHLVTGGTVTVPLRLPEATPRVEHRTDRTVLNYGSYTVETRYLQDGGVDVVYNSGFLRPLRFD